MSIPALTISGKPMKWEVSIQRLKLLTRAVDQDQLRELYDRGLSFASIARGLDVSVSDVHAAVEYYEFPPRTQNKHREVRRVDDIAEAVFTLLKPRIKEMVELRFSEMEGKIEKMVSEAILEALR